jgi:hypothetical protein
MGNVQTQVAELRKVKDNLISKKREIEQLIKSAESEVKKEAEKVLKDIESKIDKAIKAEKTGVGISDIINTSKAVFDNVNAIANGEMPPVITEFVEKHLNKKRTFIDKSTPRFAIRYGILSLGVKFGVKLEAELKGTTEKTTIHINGSVDGSAWAEASVGIGMSLSVAGYKIECELIGGARGTISLTGRAKLSLGVQGSNLFGDLNKTTIRSDFDITLFVEIPEWVCDAYWWIPDAIIPSGYPTILPERPEYNVGKWNIFNVVIPGYAATFDMKKKKFDGRVKGNFTYELGKDPKNLIKKIKYYMPFI